MKQLFGFTSKGEFVKLKNLEFCKIRSHLLRGYYIFLRGYYILLYICNQIGLEDF